MLPLGSDSHKALLDLSLLSFKPRFPQDEMWEFIPKHKYPHGFICSFSEHSCSFKIPKPTWNLKSKVSPSKLKHLTFEIIISILSQNWIPWTQSSSQRRTPLLLSFLSVLSVGDGLWQSNTGDATVTRPLVSSFMQILSKVLESLNISYL